MISLINFLRTCNPETMSDQNKDLLMQLEAIIDTAIDGIITIDVKGKIERMNPAAAGLFGYSVEEVRGHNIKMLMPQPYHSEHDGYLHRYNKTKVPHIIGVGREVKGLRKNGEVFPFRLAVSEVILMIELYILELFMIYLK